jgi:hypothetical protein
VLVKPLQKWLSGIGINFVSSFNKIELKEVFEKILRGEELEGQKLRAHVMEYHDIKFKAQMKRVLDKIYHQVHIDSHNHPSNCSDCQ